MVEGHGETVFEVGFENNGDSMALTKDEWDVAMKRLREAATKVRADCQTLLTKHVGGEEEAPSAAAEKIVECSGKILIRQHPATVEDVIETRIAVVGNVDAGKSTMLGVLVKGGLDDGRGKARVNLFRHKHEIESGRTSSVGMEIMGFDTMGKVISAEVPGRKLSWEEIGKRSAKVITFTDLAGHERYLRTTVFGLLSSSPNYCLLMVAANNGLIGMSKEHLGIALALNVPVMVSSCLNFNNSRKDALTRSRLSSPRSIFAHLRFSSRPSSKSLKFSKVQQPGKYPSLSKTERSASTPLLNSFPSASVLFSKSPTSPENHSTSYGHSSTSSLIMVIMMQRLHSNSTSTTLSLFLSLVLSFLVSSRAVLSTQVILYSLVLILLDSSQRRISGLLRGKGYPCQLLRRDSLHHSR